MIRIHHLLNHAKKINTITTVHGTGDVVTATYEGWVTTKTKVPIPIIVVIMSMTNGTNEIQVFIRGTMKILEILEMEE